MQSVVADRVAWSVGRSVTLVSPAKTNRDAVLAEDSGGPREPYVRLGSRSPMGTDNFEGGRSCPL